MDNGGNSIKQFFQQHGADVMTGVIIIITLLVLISILGINMDPIHDTHVQKIVTVENFDNSAEDSGISSSTKIDENDIPIPDNTSAICDSGYFLHEREEKCRQLTKKNCLLTDCCGWLIEKGKKDGICVSGDDRGLGYHTNDADEEIIVDKWFHRSHKTS